MSGLEDGPHWSRVVTTPALVDESWRRRLVTWTRAEAARDGFHGRVRFRRYDPTGSTVPAYRVMHTIEVAR